MLEVLKPWSSPPLPFFNTSTICSISLERVSEPRLTASCRACSNTLRPLHPTDREAHSAFFPPLSALTGGAEMQRHANCAERHIYLHFDLIWILFSSSLSLLVFYSFSSVSAITSIPYLHLPVLSFLLTHFSFLISPPFLIVGGGGGHCQRSFPDLLILSFFISPSPTSHAHTRICLNLSMQPPPTSPLLPPPCPSVAQMHLFNTSSKQISGLLSATGRR